MHYLNLLCICLVVDFIYVTVVQNNNSSCSASLLYTHITQKHIIRKYIYVDVYLNNYTQTKGGIHDFLCILFLTVNLVCCMTGWAPLKKSLLLMNLQPLHSML